MITDDEIIARCKDNDRAAQKMLFEKYADKMLGLCIRYCDSREDAKDLLQDGFYKVLIKIKNFKGNSSISTWMTRIFINLAINRKRSGRNKYHHQEFESKHESYLTTEVELEHKPEANVVMNALQQLPEKYRIVINMYAIDNMSHKEIAEQLGLTVGSSKSRLSRARVLLKAQLEKI